MARRIRLVGQRSDEVFDLPSSGSDDIDVSAAALWLAEHLPKDSPRDRALDVLCLDADGLTCAWVNTPSADESVVRAMALAGSGGEDGNEGGASVLRVYAANPLDSSMQPLGASLPAGKEATGKNAKGKGATQSVRRRMGILAGSDIAGRLLIDALDARGLGVGAACSWWHAIARAWDPAAGSSPDEAAATITTGIVIVDPGTSPRLHWAWSRHGELLAGGSSRVAGGHEGAPKLHDADAARMTADWLAWAAQLGISPSRVIVVVPEPDASGIAGSDFGAAIGRAWPGAAIDLAINNDPIGATLTRIAAAIDAEREAGKEPTEHIASAGTGGLAALSARPGRQHRRLHLWAAGAIAALAGALGVAAYRVGEQASATRGQATAAEKSWRDEFQSLKAPTPPVPGLELDYLASEISKREKELLPPEAGEATMPVREELETISLVVGLEDVELGEVSLSPTLGAKVVVTVADLARGEDLFDALSRVGGSALGTWQRRFDPVPNSSKVRCTFDAKWAVPARATTGGTTS